jgi:hypothetical protein
MSRNRVALAIVIALIGLPVASLALAETCQGELNASLFKEDREDEAVTFAWKVDVSSNVKCADVEYALIVVESTAAGEAETKEIGKRIKVSGSTSSAGVTYKMSTSKTMTSWEFKVRGCTPCGAP